MDLYKNKLAVCYKIKKENAKYDSISLFIYDMEKGKLSETYDYLSEKETKYIAEIDQISKIVFSENGNYLAISKSWRSLSGEDEQSKMISIYDMKNGEIVQRFGTKSVLDLCL